MKDSQDLKLISHNMGRINNPDDSTLPFKMEMECSTPSLCAIALFIFVGSEKLVVRGKTQDAILGFIRANDYGKHPRLKSLKVTNTDTGEIVLDIVK